MIITKSEPYTTEEIVQLREEHDTYIKTVFDFANDICSAGAEWHFHSEQLLLGQGSKQSNLWGGGVDLRSGEIMYNSLINERPNNNNPSMELLDANLRKRFDELTKYFFKVYFDSHER